MFEASDGRGGRQRLTDAKEEIIADCIIDFHKTGHPLIVSVFEIWLKHW